MIRYDPRDMSRVYLAEPGGTYLEVPYRDLGHARVSQRELQRGAQLLRKLGVAAIDEDKLFRVVLEQRSIVESATNKTQKARRQLQEQRANRCGRSEPQTSQVRVPAEPETVAEPFPFEIWK